MLDARLVLSLSIAVLSACQESQPDTQPVADTRTNIVLFVADDLGFSDLGAFGGEIRTPNLDGLAAEGFRLTGFYASPNCSPTRAMVLSGVDHHRVGLGTMTDEWDENQKGVPGYEGYLTDRAVTVAKLLKDAGYHTSMVGKWHLGVAEPLRPNARGFERSFAILPGGASHFSDATGVVRVARPLYTEDDVPVELPDDFYSSKTYSDRAIEFITEAKDAGKPFFSYIAYTAPHWPLQVPDEYLDLYQGDYDDGYEVLAASRFERIRERGFFPNLPQSAPSPPPHIPGWGSLSEDEMRRESKKMEIYAAMVERLDHHVGRVLDHLRAIDAYENTLILFMSDNGPEGNDIANLEDNRTWLPERFDNRIENMGRLDSYVFYGSGWARAGAMPFHWYKSYVYEGGIRVPAIVRLPHQSEGGGSIKDGFATVLDLTPTFLELAGAAHPGSIYQGREVQPPSGRSLLSYLSGETERVHEIDRVHGWELFGRRALRRGDWKLSWMDAPWGEGQWRLFDLALDPTEQNDLAQDEPERVEELRGLWEEYVRGNGLVLPTRDMGYANPKP